MSKNYQPTNDNVLQLSKFTLAFPNLPFGLYYCQDIILPGISTSGVTIDTPFSKTYRHGDKLDYDPLVITVLCDEDMRVWEETFNWLSAVAFPEGYAQYAQVPLYGDAVLTTLKNSNLTNLMFKFKACHPISMSQLRFSTKVNANDPPVFDVQFRYDTFILERPLSS